MEKRQTVIYIISDRRSGSTLLENILSKSSEVISVGELAMLKGHVLKQGPGERWNWNCSCGEPVMQCVFWEPVLKDTYEKDPSSFNTNIEWNFKSKKLLTVAAFPSLSKNRLLKIISNKKNRDVAVTLGHVYNKIFEQTGKPFIVDSSKDPLQALCLYISKRNFDVKIIWLKRDLRAIAVSKSKWKELNIKKQKTLNKLLFDVFYYRRICEAVASFIKQEDILRLNYEKLAQNTQAQLDNITTKFEMQRYSAPEYMFVEDDHTIGGTPNRFEKRPIVYEESWKKNYEKKKMLYLAGEVLNKL
jgi:hypothetical protein